MEKMEFRAESRRLLDLVVNSIYTHREIFLREIISNASDALDKLCYISLTDDSMKHLERDDFRIDLDCDVDARTITVRDNGVGMTREELENSLGVIAHSGSELFRHAMEGEAAQGLDIIGQFGVGFYSSFMVADRVIVETRSYASEQGYRWESDGADGYTIEECSVERIGTSIIMHLKPDSDDEKYSDYLSKAKLSSLVRKYSDYISWPIYMLMPGKGFDAPGGFSGFDFEDDDNDDDADSEPALVEQIVNSRIPIWQRTRADVSDEDCVSFYKEKYFDTETPISIIRVSAEGTVSYKALLFIPARPPYDFYTRDYKPGIQLYSNGILIMESCDALLPECFHFVRGVVDSPDLSLNISREMLQHDRQLRVISKNLEKKVKSELLNLLENKREKYELFYSSFGMQLRYNIVQDYNNLRPLLEDLLMFYSAAESRMITIREYIANMAEGQRGIYYASAPSVPRALALPQTEELRRRGFDFLCATQDVSDFVLNALVEFDGYPIRSVNSADLEFDDAEEPDDSADIEPVEQPEEISKLVAFLELALEGKVAAVVTSTKLVDSPICLSSQGEVSLEMERYFAAMPGSDAGLKAERVLEINPEHQAIQKLAAICDSEPERARSLAMLLLFQGLLTADMPIQDPGEFTEHFTVLF